jgi:type I restriction enzyme, S subunit
LAVYLNRGIPPEYNDEGDSYVINQKCIRNGILSFEQARRQKKSFNSEKRMRIGDVLINSTGTGTLGRTAQVWRIKQNCTVDSHVTIVRPFEDYEKFWFGFTLLSFESLFETMGEGATNQTELKRQKIADVQVLVPKKGLRQQFDEFAADVIAQINNLNCQNNELRKARDLLLPRLMNGEIAV